MKDEDVMARSETLAQNCALAGVLENQLGTVLAHLKRHRDVAGTRRLLTELTRSPFATRTKSTRKQLEGLAEHVHRALGGVRSWQEAARIVGWAKRLSPVFRHRTH